MYNYIAIYILYQLKKKTLKKMLIIKKVKKKKKILIKIKRICCNYFCYLHMIIIIIH